jgi:hypothetical protein
MCGVSHLVGHHRAADAGMLGPAFHTGLEERAVNNQLATAVEQVGQARLPFGPVELVFLFHGHPRHPPALGRQRVTSVGQLLLLYEKLLSRSLPLQRGHHFRHFHLRCQDLCVHILPFAL